MSDSLDSELIALTADIVAAFVANNKVATSELSDLIAQVHSSLANVGAPAPAQQAEQEPAVSVRSSIKHDYIVCLEDGKKLKMLKRYLRTNYDMTPEEYRTKWKLPRDYPMVAPAYAEQRRGLAVAIGLGRKAGSVVKDAVGSAAESVVEAVTPKAPAKRGRPPMAKAATPKAAVKPKSAKAAKEAAAKHLGGATGVDG